MNLIRKFWKPAPKVSTESTDSHPVRVEAIVVEDHQDEADMLCGLLRMQSVQVTWAGNIAGAIGFINSDTRFQLAFVDLGLPDGSGIEIVRKIKDSRRMTHVIVVSGAIEKIPLVLSYGYIGLLGKPFSISSIREILYKHRLPYAD